jgi:hypothetical protein
MRLTEEIEFDNYRKAVNQPTCWVENKKCNECTYQPMCNLVNKLLDTIEAQQQEIQQRGEWIDNLSTRNLQLQAQNAEKNDAISKAVEFINAGLYCDDEEKNCEAECDKRFGDCLLEVLKAASSETPDYHNPADVAEIARLAEWHGCGCGIYLAHNNMICPKLAEKAGGEK